MTTYSLFLDSSETASATEVVGPANAVTAALEALQTDVQDNADAASASATAAASSATTAATNAANAARARSWISGRITAITWDGTPFASGPTVTLGTGYHWEENNSGTVKRTISALSATAIGSGQAIVVNFDSGTDPWTPALVTTASGGAPDWQTDDAYVLVGRDAQGTLYGHYVNSTPDLMFSDTAARNARKVMTGLAVVNADGTIDFSLGALHKESNSGVPEKTIDAYAAAPALASNEAYFADIDNGPFNAGKVTLTKGLMGSATYTGWIAGNRYVVLAKDANGNYSAPTGYVLKTVRDSAPDLVTVIKAGSQINVISPLTNGKSVNFILKRETNVGNRVDIWRMDEAWLATGVNGSFSSVRPFTDGGETEVAIMMSGGATDFMGGLSHGDQTATFMTVMLDGTTISSDGTYYGRVLRILQRSTLTDPDAALNPARFYLDSEHTFRATGKMTYRGCLTATGTPQVAYCYVGMLKPKLTYSAANVMTAAYFEEPWQSVDLTTTIPGGLTSKGRKVVYTGTGGMFASMEITQGWNIAGRQLYLAPSSPTGKSYFNHVGNAGNYTFADGERMEFKVEYEFGVA